MSELLNVKNLRTYYHTRVSGESVEDVSFTVNDGETFGWWESPAAARARCAAPFCS